MKKNGFVYQQAKKSPPFSGELHNHLYKLLYAGRDFFRRDMFTVIRKYCKGSVLDVGGRDFFPKAKAHGVIFSRWTNLESIFGEYYPVMDSRYQFVVGDGCKLKFKDNTFDTILNLHVLEHVFEPIQMVKEASRVLKKNGYAIFLIPNSATLHMAPHHYYNFTRFWIKKVMEDQGLKIIELKPLGGLWQTISARLFYFFIKSIRVSGMSTKYDQRNLLFYLLFPVACLYALVSMPITLFFSLGDLTEDPNDHLVVVRKR